MGGAHVTTMDPKICFDVVSNVGRWWVHSSLSRGRKYLEFPYAVLRLMPLALHYIHVHQPREAVAHSAARPCTGPRYLGCCTCRRCRLPLRQFETVPVTANTALYAFRRPWETLALTASM